MIFGNITISFSSSTAPANYKILGSFRFDPGYENEYDHKMLLLKIIHCKHGKYVLKTEANDLWENLRNQNLKVVLIFVAVVESIKLLALFGFKGNGQVSAPVWCKGHEIREDYVVVTPSVTNDDLLFLLVDKHKRSFSYISLFLAANNVFPVHATRHSWTSYVQHQLICGECLRLENLK